MYKKRWFYKVLFALFIVAVCLPTAAALADAVPNAVTDLRANPGVSSIDLSWSAIISTPTVSDYEVFYRQLGDTAWTTFNDGVSPSPNVTISGLTNGAYYEFKVIAVNSVGESADSNIEVGVPLAETFTDDFEGYTVGSDINGQNGWVAGGTTSPYTIQSIDASQVLGSTTGSDCFTTNTINNAVPEGATNVHMKVDFRYSGDGGVQPVLWMRRPGSIGDAGGYVAFRSIDNRSFLQRQPVGGGCGLYQIGPSGTRTTLTAGNWYTAEADTISLPDGTERLRFYIYPRGGTRGDAVVSGIDTTGLYKSGEFGLGRNTSTQVYYDNLHVYSAPSVPQLPPAASNVYINGSSYADGSQLTGNYSYSDINGDQQGVSTFRWLRSDTQNGTYTAIPGATSTTYTPTEDDLGKYVKFEVTPVSVTAPTIGTPVVSDAIGKFVSSQYWGILLTGQSHATGYNASPALSVSRHNWNTMPSDGVEGTDPYLDNLYEAGLGENGNVETPASGLANTFFDQNPKHPVFISIAGKSGYGYASIKKGTAIYTKALTQAQNAATDLVNSWNGTYLPKAVAVIHGETDWLSNLSSSYESSLVEWQNDYKTDLNAINGTNEAIPFFLLQANTPKNGLMADAQLQAFKDHPTTIIMVGPKYQFQTVSDNAHFTNLGSREAGELMGKVMERVLTEGQTWNPLMPTTITRDGKVITVSFNIPNPPLAIDTTTVAARLNDGFEFYQTGGNTVSISDVALSSDNSQVIITLSDVPTGTEQTLKYAWTCPVNASYWCMGAANSNLIGGNIRDSDNFVSPSSDSSGATLYNWLVAFSQSVIDQTPVYHGRPVGKPVGSGHNPVFPTTPPTTPAQPSVPANPKTPATPGTPACPAYLPPQTVLARNRTNDKDLVIKLQQFLKDQGIGNLPEATGNFLSKTKAAVNQFQTMYATDILAPYGLTKPTGIVGPKTVQKINLLSCGKK